MTVEEIKDLMKTFEDSSIGEFEYKNEGEKLHLKKASDAWNAPGSETDRKTGSSSEVQAESAETSAEGSAEVTSGRPDQTDDAQASGTKVTTPIAGIFYRAPKPGEKPFVEVGQKVRKGDTVGLIEAMKMISEIPAPCDGVISKITANDAEFVQFGTELMMIGEQ